MVYQLSKASILVVDDMQPMLALTSSLLKIFGFENIILAHDAEEGFRKFCEHNPDIVLTDWLMAPYDGTELIHKIRNDDASPNKFVPIIMMTGYSHKIRVEQARDSGVTEFLVKPFRAKDLFARVEQLIEKPRRFVDARSFFGPDRRRKKPADYMGPFRRGADEFQEIAMMEKNEAVTLLRELKKKAKETARDKKDKE
ncbi:MAG: response regulator [Rhodospirillales bacterium]|nr:response regulator [Rhodospirillales bacterium]MCB9995234.1 response regulator [Rhodospirillales bacterium]